MGIVAGAVLMAGLAYVYVTVLENEKTAMWISLALMVALGVWLAGVPGIVLGVIFGLFFWWFTHWLFEGRYRARLLPYLTPGQVLWEYSFKVICGIIFFFLMSPLVPVMWLSFNAQDFFTFTPEMLRFDPAGYSLKHYQDFFSNNEWQRSFKNSLIIAPIATIILI